MARIVGITYTPHRPNVAKSEVLWVRSVHGRRHDQLPQLFWNKGRPWREANLWLLERATDVDMRTVQTNASALLGYANWLESTQTDWKEFPARKSERCLVRYRGALIEARRESKLASSTVSQRMRQVIAFYRWVNEAELITNHNSMWRETSCQLTFQDSTGFARTISVQSTDLRIPNRRAISDQLEGGLVPVSSTVRTNILRFVREKGSEELFLMLALGFFTGIRIGTICDLKVETIVNAIADPNSKDLFWLALGPGAVPPVATKFGVTGQAWISRVQLEHLRRYASSVRRAKRETLADDENKNLLFLTRFGGAYSHPTANKSGAINVQMHALRNMVPGGDVLRDFHFHQSRCTFATELARVAVEFGGPMVAIGIVMQALLQRDEQTAMKYIKFVEKGDIRRTTANEFTERFLGLFPSDSDWIAYE
jgi:integrase